MNFLDGTLTRDGLALGRHRLDLPLELRRGLSRSDGNVVVGLRPEDIRLVENGADDGLDAEVVITEQLGPEVLVYLRVDGVRVASSVRDAAVDRDEAVELRETLVARLPGDTRVRAGQSARFALHSAGVNLFDPGSGESLLTR